MPMPTPGADETENDFIDRCMTDAVMVEEYDDEDQRLAVCHSQWEGKDEMNKSLISPFQVKAFDEEERTFTGLASTWELDLGGDVIRKGAFKDTLKAWKSNGATLPLLDSHNGWGTVRAVVGKMLDAKETDDGLEAEFKVIEGPDGDEVYRRIKGGYATGLSIGYQPKEIETPDETQMRKGIYRILKRVDLMEVSVVIWPMNTGARIRDVKKFIDNALDGIDPAQLDDEDKQDLRCIAGRCGSFLRPSAPEGAPTAGEKQADADPPCPAASQPEVPPASSADAPKAIETEPLYRFDEALQMRISGVRTRQTRLNIQSPTE